MTEFQKNKIEEFCCDTNITIKKVNKNKSDVVIIYVKKCFNNINIENFGLIKENGEFELLLSERV